MSNHPSIPTPFDSLDNFEPHILNIIDEYLDYDLSSSYYHWFYAWGLTSDVQAALLTACNTSNLDDVKYLVSQGADVTARDNSIMHWAIGTGRLDLIKYLVSQGVDVTTLDHSAIFLAARGGHLDVIKYLMSQGIDFTFRDYCSLHRALRYEYL